MYQTVQQLTKQQKASDSKIDALSTSVAKILRLLQRQQDNNGGLSFVQQASQNPLQRKLGREAKLSPSANQWSDEDIQEC